MSDENSELIKAMQKYLIKYYNSPLTPTEERNFSQFKYKFVELPLDTLFLMEYIDDLLRVYKTVSVEKTKDSYRLKVQGRKDNIGEH